MMLTHYTWSIVLLTVVTAVQKCPIYEDANWILVRRTTGTAHQADDNLSGTEVYGDQHNNMRGDSFSVDFSSFSYSQILFITGDCQHWVKMDKTEIDAGPWGSGLSSRTVLGTNYQNSEHQLLMKWDSSLSKNPIITNIDNSGNGCGIVYSEDGELGQACGTDGEWMSLAHQGLNVYILNTTTTTQVQIQSSGPWSLDGMVCSTDMTTFDDVASKCSAMGMVPLTLHSLEERDLYLSSDCNDQNRWVGLTDQVVEGQWLDVHGNEVTNVGDWASVDNDQGTEHCMSSWAAFFLQWPNDIECDTSFGYACINEWGDAGAEAAPSQDATTNDCRETNMCQAWGTGTHVFTFDGNMNNIFEAGKFQLVETTVQAQMELGLPYIQISMTTEKVSVGSLVSFIAEVEMKFATQDNSIFYTIRLNRNGASSILINDRMEQSLFVQDTNNFKFSRFGNDLIIQTWTGVILSFKNGNIKVRFPPNFP